MQSYVRMALIKSTTHYDTTWPHFDSIHNDKNMFNTWLNFQDVYTTACSADYIMKEVCGKNVSI